MAACTAPAASSNAATATIIHCTRLHDSSFPFPRHGAGARIRGHVVTTRQPNPSFLLLPSPEDCGSRLQTAGGKTRNRRGPGESLLVKEGRSNARVAARRKTCGENKGKGDGSNAKAAPTGWAFRQPDAYRRGSRVRCAARGGRQPKRLSHPDGRLRPLRAHAAFADDFFRRRLPPSNQMPDHLYNDSHRDYPDDRRQNGRNDRGDDGETPRPTQFLGRGPSVSSPPYSSQ